MYPSFLETSPPCGVQNYVKWWYCNLFQPDYPVCLSAFTALSKKNTVGILFKQLFQLCLICPTAIPHPPHPSLVPSIILPSWAPFLPLSIRSITELWLSHFNIPQGCNTQNIISLLKMKWIIKICFPSLQHPHSVPWCGPARWQRGVRKESHVIAGCPHCRHLLVNI